MDEVSEEMVRMKRKKKPIWKMGLKEGVVFGKISVVFFLENCMKRRGMNEAAFLLLCFC